MTNRTDELRASGAVARTKEVSGDASMEPAAYVKWGDDYAYVEGQVKELWDSPKGYGESVSMALTSCSDNLMGKLGTEIVAADSNIGTRLSGLVISWRLAPFGVTWTMPSRSAYSTLHGMTFAIDFPSPSGLALTNAQFAR